MLALASAVWVLAAAPNKDLQRGTELFEQYKYAEARAAFTKARAQPNLTRAELLDLLEMTGVAAAQQRQADAAETAFVELFTLDAEHKLKADYAPKVMTPFYEARRIVGERGSLEASAAAATSAERVESVTVTVVKDPLRQVRSVRFHLQANGTWTTATAAPAAATFEVKQPTATWWAELLGDNNAQLALLGTADQPRSDAPPKAAPPPAVALAAPPPTPPPFVEERHGSPLRPVSYAVVAVALVAGGLGGYFGWRSGSDYAHITGSAMNGAGVLAITEHDANVFEAHGQQSALIANTLFISAGVLALAGVLMWILGAP